ncbi:hypothetical protein CORC01_08549 [Colletotrichum orchidophilum]|uniref:Uncharacterized protein n=1 Tax=Colletotrichum orchidophilum TaxID=1209926 RepID=A0A1G4B4H1_9PEZI|nr:uncharacterized protein CORC01_08549 [Colletotrichum orchidophilum]OHE96172.1 hypothetical protein CORC01_08549 [Colletotrichum orchidophilum]
MQEEEKKKKKKTEASEGCEDADGDADAAIAAENIRMDRSRDKDSVRRKPSGGPGSDRDSCAWVMLPRLAELARSIPLPTRNPFPNKDPNLPLRGCWTKEEGDDDDDNRGRSSRGLARRMRRLAAESAGRRIRLAMAAIARKGEVGRGQGTDGLSDTHTSGVSREGESDSGDDGMVGWIWAPGTFAEFIAGAEADWLG